MNTFPKFQLHLNLFLVEAPLQNESTRNHLLGWVRPNNKSYNKCSMDLCLSIDTGLWNPPLLDSQEGGLHPDSEKH